MLSRHAHKLTPAFNNVRVLALLELRVTTSHSDVWELKFVVAGNR